jgi:hypothetical protein
MTKWIGTVRYNKKCEMTENGNPCKRSAIHKQFMFDGTDWIMQEVCLDHKLEFDNETRKKKLQELESRLGHPIQQEEEIIMLVEENIALKNALVQLLKEVDYHHQSNTFRGQRTVTWGSMHAAIDNAKSIFGIELRTCIGDK